ncbi:MAG: ABC transporter permease [Clostridia bacterium]|nr:ABC transporter permease [Clostridia bacterium]MBQ5480837.1 ABC transporter permease [Clostridia bacterium]MBQ6525688.1 ABC transporter permease [Clostridia bacterium]
MGKYVGKRLLSLVPILLGITFLTFLLLYIAPGDPAQKRLSSNSGVAVTQEQIDNMREEMGLNRPFLVQYGSWLGHALTGDLGTSYKDSMPVSGKLGPAFRRTLILAGVSLLISLLVSIPTGILSAVYRGSFSDHLFRLLSFVGNSLPNFLLSILLMYFLCIKVDLFPVIATGSVQGLFLPALALAIPMASRFVRQIRAEVLEELGRDYVTGLTARGVRSSWVLFRNVLRNASSSILTIVALAVGTLMGGSVVVESIFNWPGIGKLAMDSISARDYPVIQGFVLIMAVVYVLVNLLTDLCHHWLDPRVELE